MVASTIFSGTVSFHLSVWIIVDVCCHFLYSVMLWLLRDSMRDWDGSFVLEFRMTADCSIAFLFHFTRLFQVKFIRILGGLMEFFIDSGWLYMALWCCICFPLDWDFEAACCVDYFSENCCFYTNWAVGGFTFCISIGEFYMPFFGLVYGDCLLIGVMSPFFFLNLLCYGLINLIINGGFDNGSWFWLHSVEINIFLFSGHTILLGYMIFLWIDSCLSFVFSVGWRITPLIWMVVAYVWYLLASCICMWLPPFFSVLCLPIIINSYFMGTNWPPSLFAEFFSLNAGSSSHFLLDANSYQLSPYWRWSTYGWCLGVLLFIWVIVFSFVVWVLYLDSDFTL